MGARRVTSGAGKWSVAIGVAAIAVLAACALAWRPIAPRRTAHVKDATPVGSAECMDCHAKVNGHEKIAEYHGDCESCHGNGSLHAESQEPEDIRFPDTTDCLACHERGRDTHLAWGTGEHARAGLLCSDCHNAHEPSRNNLRVLGGTALAPRSAAPPGLFLGDSAVRICTECHEDVAARFQYPSHHPVNEGMLSCTSCHDPHGDSRVTKGDGTTLCLSCHQAQAGPWIYEHEPVAEDCLECHDPHGAPADALLSSPQPVICLECHSLADLWHHNTSGTGIRGNSGATTNYPGGGHPRGREAARGAHVPARVHQLPRRDPRIGHR